MSKLKLPPAPSVLPLRVNDLLFVNEYMANGRNGTQAYRKVHPKASYKVASIRACRVVAKDSVRAEIAKRITHAGGITREFVETALLTHYHTAEQKGDYLAGASIAMDCAKLAGFLVEKRQDVTPPASVTPDQLTEALRARGFVPVPVN